MNKTTARVTVEDIMLAYHTVKDVVEKTPLQRNQILSEQFGCNVYLKREDLQIVRSFKIRGAYNHIRNLTAEERERGVVCASAGNHAQGFAFSCASLGISGTVFMPATTPRQKVSQVKLFGGDWVEVVLTGDTFDDSYAEAVKYTEENGRTFVHPFDDPKIIAGQGTVGMEIMAEMSEEVDYVFAAIGGGGLISGIGTYMKSISLPLK